METIYLVLLLCAATFAHASKRHAYYYPPTYGKTDDLDYTPIKMKQHRKSGVSYYYPPVYGGEEKEDYGSSFSSSEEDDAPNESEMKAYYVEKPSYGRRHRSYYKRPSKVADEYKVRKERRYMDEEEPVAETFYKEPEQKSYRKKKKTMKCLQCEYSPPRKVEYEVLVREPKTVQIPKEIEECQWEKNIEYVYVEPRRGSKHMYGRYKEVPKYEKTCYPKTIYETKTIYRNRYVKKHKLGQSGGFEACKGPLTAYTAKKYGVDDWDCHNNCYVKQDKSGTIIRGCYSGQYKVDPKRLGCHYQGDSSQDLYCFCKGDHCNGKSVPTPM